MQNEVLRKKARILFCIKCHKRARKQQGMYSFFYECPTHKTSTQFVEKGVKGLTKGCGSINSHTHIEHYHISGKPFDFISS